MRFEPRMLSEIVFKPFVYVYNKIYSNQSLFISVSRADTHKPRHII